MYRRFIDFLTINRRPLIAISCGIILGYIHWYYWGCYWGSYPFSSELSVNCCYGGLFIGFINSLFQKENI